MNKKIVVSSNLKDIKQVVSMIVDLLKNIKAEESDVFDIRLSLEEALINAIKYGNKLDEKRRVYIDFTYNDNKITIAVEDEGAGFDYPNLPDPTREENLLKSKGRGIFLIRHLMDKVEFNKKGNRITITKHIKKSNRAEAYGATERESPKGAKQR